MALPHGVTQPLGSGGHGAVSRAPTGGPLLPLMSPCRAQTCSSAYKSCWTGTRLPLLLMYGLMLENQSSPRQTHPCRVCAWLCNNPFEQSHYRVQICLHVKEGVDVVQAWGLGEFVAYLVFEARGNPCLLLCSSALWDIGNWPADGHIHWTHRDVMSLSLAPDTRLFVSGACGLQPNSGTCEGMCLEPSPDPASLTSMPSV